MNSLLLCALLAFAVPTGKPEEAGMSGERLRRVHEAVQRHISAGSISGAVTLVARKGRVVHFESHGLMDIESNKPMARDTIFRLASMSKPVTGAAVLMLMEEGKLRLGDPVSRFLPEFKEMKVAVPRTGSTPPFFLVPADREVTIRDLLTHTSGLGSGGAAASEVAVLMKERKPADTLADLARKMAALPLDFQPGSQWRYSGLLGFDLLSRIVEVVSGQAYDRFLQERIFAPLGMKDMSFHVPAEKRPRLVTLYRRGADGKLEKNPNQEALMSQTYFSGAGGLTGTAEDYLQFGQMLVNGGELNGKRLLSPRTVDLMASNHVGDMFNGQLGRPARGMGFGLSVGIVQDNVSAGWRVSSGSFGWDGAFGTLCWVDPKEKMVMVLMIQTQVSAVLRDFENSVLQAIVE